MLIHEVECPFSSNQIYFYYVLPFDNDCDYCALSSGNGCTVKLGNKEQFDKEQISIKEPSRDQFAIYSIRIKNFWH